MKPTSSFSAFAPVTIGNFGIGFDVLGAAVQPENGELWGDLVDVFSATPATPDRHLQVTGPYASLLPADPAQNLVLVAEKLFSQELTRRKKKRRPVAFRLDKRLPLCSGLGSSASSVVAALAGLNAFYGEPLSRDELVPLAGRAEGAVSGSIHIDNVAPCLLGGLQLICPEGKNREVARALPVFDNWRMAVVHPHLQVPTKLARSILPPAIPMKKAVAYWQNLGSFIHALYARDEALVAHTLHDLIIEGYRRRLVKGFGKVQKAALEAGAFGCTLSGSGPSMFAVTGSSRQAGNVLQAMLGGFAAVRVKAEGYVCRIDPFGARILRNETHK
jgi:homoserine kinase